MNALELADKFKLDPLNAEIRSEVVELMIKSYSESKTYQAAYKLLLQDIAKQQAEIEELKALLKKSAEVNRLLAEEIGYE